MDKLNISSLDVLPEEITKVFSVIHDGSDLWGIECKLTKQTIQVGSLDLAAQNLYVAAQTVLDADGKPVYQDRETVSPYHTVQSWKDNGLLNPGTDGYPSITGCPR